VKETNYSILSDFELSQNYPNPFNPTTKIKFTIPVTLSGVEGSIVTLKIYDVLGNEIETLVNEQKPAGTYEVEFGASGLASGISAKGGYSSGVYFYQLQATPSGGQAVEFVETKKMVLMK
jgi:hypothetical protein